MHRYICTQTCIFFPFFQEVYLDYLLLARHRPPFKNNLYFSMAEALTACMKLGRHEIIKALDALLRSLDLISKMVRNERKLLRN